MFKNVLRMFLKTDTITTLLTIKTVKLLTISIEELFIEQFLFQDIIMFL